MKKVLIIDDSPFMTQMFSLRLNSTGVEPLIAGDGETGIKIAKLEDPNCILLDISMPKMDGWEVLQALKADGKTKNIPVLILTNSKGTADEIQKSKDLGAAEYLMKVGQKVDDIIEVVKKYL